MRGLLTRQDVIEFFLLCEFFCLMKFVHKVILLVEYLRIMLKLIIICLI